MYQHGRRVERPHNYKIFLATIAVIGVVVLGVWFLIHKDIANTTEPKSNVPIISTVGDTDNGTVTVSEPYFTFELPKDWKLKDQVHQNYANFYRWVSTKPGADDRTLIIHVDIMPKDYKLVKLQPITPNGASLILGNVSDDCTNFSGGVGKPTSNASYLAKWQDVSFMCDPISNNQTVGTGSKDNGIAVPVAGASGKHAYFFYFEDHNIRPDTTIFRNILQSFKAK